MTHKTKFVILVSLSLLLLSSSTASAASRSGYIEVYVDTHRQDGGIISGSYAPEIYDDSLLIWEGDSLAVTEGVSFFSDYLELRTGVPLALVLHLRNGELVEQVGTYWADYDIMFGETGASCDAVCDLSRCANEISTAGRFRGSWTGNDGSNDVCLSHLPGADDIVTDTTTLTSARAAPNYIVANDQCYAATAMPSECARSVSGRRRFCACVPRKFSFPFSI